MWECRPYQLAQGNRSHISQRKEKEIPDSSRPKNPDYTDNDAIKRNKQGRLDTSATNDIGENLTPGEKFVKRAWLEAVFPNDLNNESYTSVKNKVVLKPEWRLVVANSEVFTKLSSIQNALQMALIPYNLWAHRVTIDMSGDFLGIRNAAADPFQPLRRCWNTSRMRWIRQRMPLELSYDNILP
ncbi:Bgt-20204 [Blumeria graminis f. sp. tritici]|uniref:Bgt-20204 n=2 Tax=Blumeria graminis f. sp. tritici TaxID=62690 RepID=A0A9X9L729_BLUGR|nr:Bgt-20204 [Blumeria graminis f. sp. tritici]